MPGPCSAPNGDSRLTSPEATIRVCSVHGTRLHECSKARSARCHHSLQPLRRFLHKRNRLRTGKTPPKGRR